MKTFSIFFAISFILLSFSCSEPDDIYMGSKTISIDNLIEIETKTTYQLNDVLYINCYFSRYLPEPGFQNLLDVYKTTNSEKYYFGFQLEKKSAYGTWSTIDIGTNLVQVKGNSNNYDQNSGICVLNQLTNQYEFRAGIPLLEKGNYRLRTSSYLNPSYSNNFFINLSIKTTTKNMDTNDYYTFSVD